MEVKTKFKIGQLVWYMRQNSAVQGYIKKIIIEAKLDEAKNNYSVSIHYSGNWYKTQWEFGEYEHRCFATKDELLKSL